MPVHDMNIARASALSLYMTRTTPYVNTMAGSAISGHAKAASGRPGVGRSVVPTVGTTAQCASLTAL